jgi:feruloyl-CoA synthase
MRAFISHDVVREDRPDGAILLRTRVPLGPVAGNTGAWLHRWAKDAPDRVLLAERSGQGWRELRYADALQQVRSLASVLISTRTDPGFPLRTDPA